MLLRPQTVMAGAGAPTSRKNLAVSGVQLVSAGGMSWSKKPVFLRNAPYTAVPPHVGKIEGRIAFAQAAHAANGAATARSHFVIT